MNFTTLFIKRPVMTTLVMVGILFFGIVAYRELPVSDLPNVDYPTITVIAQLPGASPATMAATVATPLEKQFSTIAGIDNMTSTSSVGQTQIVVQFSLDRNIDGAAQDVQAAITQTQRTLPQGILPPSYQKTNPADAPIITLALTSDVVPLSTLDEFGEVTLAQRLSMVGGVAQVLVEGTQKYAVRIQLDPAQLQSRDLGLEDINQAISGQNVNYATGILWGTKTALTIQATGQLENAAEFADMIVAYRNGAPVHLRDVGQVTDNVQNDKTASWLGNQHAIVLEIQRQPGTNTVLVANRIKASLAKLSTDIPPSVHVTTLYDRSASIDESVSDVKFTLLLTLVLVVLVIFVFLRNMSATIIPSLALPMSIIGTFSVMYLLNYSLDNLSLMALTLAVGFVVDDAIVMLENIVRHLEMGKQRVQAAIDGAAEVGFTILSMTLSLSAVFIPILFMGGIIGKLFHEFAVTIGVSILVSGFVSLTLTPMLSSLFLRSQQNEQHGRFYNVTERGFDWVLHGYERSLAWVMKRRRETLVFSGFILVATAVLFYVIPKGLFPTDDTGQLLGTTEAVQGVSYDGLIAHQQEVADIIRRDPDVRAVTSSVGTLAAANQGQLTIDLKPVSDRHRSADEIARDLSKAVLGVPGLTVFIQNPPAIEIGGLQSKSLYQFTLQSGNMALLNESGAKLEARMRQLPLLTGVTSDLLIENPQVTIDIDRQHAGELGITAAEIENTLYDAFGQRQVSTIYTPTNEYWVVMEVLPQYQQDIASLGSLWLRPGTLGAGSGAATPGNVGTSVAAGTGAPLVPLSAVASFHTDIGPVTVNHSGQLPSITISVRPRARRIARRRNQVHPAGLRRNAAVQHRGCVHRHGGGLRDDAAEPPDPDRARGVRDLPHPRRPLRKLHPPADDSLGIALRRVRRAAHTPDLRPRPRHVRPGRHHHADRYREEERDHDDRLRHRVRKQGRQNAGAGDPRSQQRPVPADHDDDDGRPHGRAPHRPRLRGRLATRRPLGVAVVGGLAFSQAVTLYVTPVFYTYLDELQTWFEKSAERRRARRRAQEPNAPKDPSPAPAGD